MRPSNNQENKTLLDTYWRVQLVCREVQTTLEPPLEYDQDQTTLMNKVYYDLFKSTLMQIWKFHYLLRFI